MLPGKPVGVARSRRNLWVLLTVGIFLLTAVPSAQAASVGASPPVAVLGAPHEPLTLPPTASASTGTTVAHAAVPHPAVSNNSVSLPFWQNATVPSGSPGAHTGPCLVYNFTTEIENLCYNWTVNPTLVPLGGSNVGLSYQFSTNISATGCPAASAPNYSTEVGFSLSTDNGTSWGGTDLIANATCSYANSLEPSFAASGSHVYGVLVEDNETVGSPPGYLYTRSPSTLGFVVSTNSGASFNPVRSLKSGSYVADPQIAVFGKTIYVVYENITNSTTTEVMGGPGYTSYLDPVAIEYMYSADGGITWSTPRVLPGWNATDGYFAINPSIAVNLSGAIAVSYFTNQSCLWNEVSYCAGSGMDLVVLTSNTNGSSWIGPRIVQKGVGVSLSNAQFNFYSNLPPNWIPESQIRYSPSGTTLFIAFDGIYDTPSLYENPEYEWSAAYLAIGSSIITAPWSVQIMASHNTTSTEDSFMMPSVSESSNGTIDYAYEWGNDTYCYSFFSATPCATFDGDFSWWAMTSTNGGANWTPPSLLLRDEYDIYGSSPYDFEDDYQGFESSVAFTPAGSPMIAYPAPEYDQETFYEEYTATGFVFIFNITFPDHLLVATPYLGPTVNVTFLEHGLPAPNWQFQFNGGTFSVSNSTQYSITDVPRGFPMFISIPSAGGSVGYGEQLIGTLSVGGQASFVSNATVYVNYTVNWALQLDIMPPVDTEAILEFTVAGGSTYYDVENYEDCFPTCYTYTYSNPPQPWYFPNGTVIDIGEEYQLGGFSYWNGTGTGSYTGVSLTGTANVTMIGHINETAWAGGFGVYNEQFDALGLPAGSVYHFTFNGSTHSTAAGQPTYVDGVLTGSYGITNVWANSSTPGWEYFGTASTGSSVLVPASPIVNFTFALEDVAASPGTISFHAVGLTAGTAWHFGFNGTEYSSSTPWINVTDHSGTYAVAGYPVVAANGSVGYTPTGLTSTWAVTAGSSYSVNFVNAYRVDAQAGVGGSISGTGHGDLWLASGSSASFHAIAATNYIFGGWSGVGVGAYSGNNTYANVTVNAPMTEVASFYPTNANRFNLTFREVGLTTGTWWSVTLGGKGYSTDEPGLIVPNLYPCGPSGTYNLSVPYAYVNSSQLTRFSPGPYAKTECTNGLTIVTLTFTPQYFVTLESTLGGVGLLSVSGLTTATSEWLANQSSAELSEAANPGYVFLGWNGTGVGSYTGAAATFGLVIGNSMTEIAAFGPVVHAPTPRYWLNITASTPLAAGTSWAVTVGTATYSSTTSWINVTGLLANSYPVVVLGTNSPDGLTRYMPIAAPPSVSVTHNASIKLTYSVSFWVSIAAGSGGQILAPTAVAGWYDSGSSLSMSASSNPGFTFLGWQGTGTGAYSGGGLNQTVVVKGPITELASFGVAPPAAKIVSSTSIWSSPTTWIGLAAVGLIVGAILGLVLGRRRPGSPSSDPAPRMSPASEASNSPSTPAAEESS